MAGVYVGIRRLSLSLGRDHQLLSPTIDVYEPFPFLSSAFGVPRMAIDNRGRYQRLNETPGSSWAGYDRLNAKYTPTKYGPGYSGDENSLDAIAKPVEARVRPEEEPATASTSSSQVRAFDLDVWGKVARPSNKAPSLRKQVHKKPASLAAINIAAATGYRRSKLGGGTDQPVAVILPSPTRADSPRSKQRPVNLPQLQIRSPSHSSYSTALSPLGSGIRLRSPMLLSLEEGTQGMSHTEKVYTPTSLSFSHNAHRMTSPKSPRSPRSAQHSPRSPRSPMKAKLSADGSAGLKSPIKKRFSARDEGFDADFGDGITKEDRAASAPFSFE